MKTLIKYIKIYPYFIAMSIKSKLAYKVDAILGAISFILINVISFSTIYLTISCIPSLDGWTIENVAFLYGFCLIPKSIDHIFTDKIWFLAGNSIKNGSLDIYITRPLNTLFIFLADDIQLDGLGEFILGIVLICLYGKYQNIVWSFNNIFPLLICAFFSIFLFTSIKLIYGSIAFWTKRSIEILNSVYALSEYTKYPIKIFDNFVKVILTYIIPFSLALYYPISYLYEGKSIWLLTLIVVTVIIILCLFSYYLWVKGLKKYESAGS